MTGIGGNAPVSHWGNRHPGLVDAALALALAAPAVVPLLNRLTRGYDTPLHILRFALFDRAIAAGQALPRWSPDLMAGYGYPLFNFYAPGVYYLGLLFRRLGADWTVVFQAVAALLLGAAAVGAWRFCRDLVDDESEPAGPGRRVAALLGAVLYLYAPYLLINAYVRGAIAEIAAQALLPWALWLLRRSIRRPDPLPYAFAATLAFAGIVFSHTISLLLIPPFVAVLAVAQLHARPERWRWVGVVGLFSSALTTVFWLPLFIERGAVGTTAYVLALPSDVETFLKPPNWIWAALPYPYDRITAGLSFGLSPLHLVLGGLSLAVLWKRLTHELAMLGLAALVVAVLQLDVTRQLWSIGGLIDVVQAPSRLQTVLYLSTAALTAVAVANLPRFVERRPLGLALMVAAISVAAPWSTHAPLWLESTRNPGAAQIAHAEVIARLPGLSIYPEFLPRWVDDYSTGLASPAPAASTDATAQLTALGPSEYRLTVHSATDWELRAADFYFPGWAAWIDGEPVDVEPSTPLGLVTLAVPAGTHELRVAFAGSDVQHVAAWLSTLTGAILTGLLVWRRRGMTAIVAALVTGAMLWIGPFNSLHPIIVTRRPDQVNGAPFDLLDLQAAQVEANRVEIRAVWFVRHTAPDVSLRWALRDAQGQIVASTQARPWFDHVHSQAWPAGTLADDRAEIVLPGGLPVGTYALTACAQPEAERAIPCDPVSVVEDAVSITTATPPSDVSPARFRFEGGLELVDAVLETRQGDRDLASDVAAVTPWDVLVLRLRWRVHDWLMAEHLDSSPIVMTQQNDRLSYSTMPLAGLQGWSRAVPPGDIIVDRQQIILDPSAAGGRYPLTVRVFDPASTTYLRALDEAGAPMTDVVTVGQVKVVVPTSMQVDNARPATLGDVAHFIGFSLSIKGNRIRPGDTLTLTVAYRALRPADRDLTQFAHLYDPTRGLVGQSDSPPLAGNNPAPGWIIGEVIRDVFQIQIADDAPSGNYALLWGLYDPATGERVPITLPDGTQPADRALLLETLQVVAP